MPGKIKVKVLAGRNLPVMDRASDTTDAFVEIKFGGVTHKTDVCRKSLNPHWNNTEWYRFEVDESELQDEPLQLRLMDHDTYSANDAIGKVVISLAPLLAREANNVRGTAGPPGGAVMSGWIPVFDTMHGIRGELNVIVKVELFSDFNKYKTSSCGVQFFHCPSIPPGYKATSVHGFVEELVVNDDPEYQWIDKIRTPRASNEARQVAFIKLGNQVQRLVGLKAAELGANAVVGYQQEFDLEGEAGVVARAIGTAVSITPLPTPSQPMNIPTCTQQQLKQCLDILATDDESVTDLNQYYQTHQEELQKVLSILTPKDSSLLDEPEAADDDDDRLEQPRLSIHSYTGAMSLFQDDYLSHKSLRHLSEDQTDLNKLLNRRGSEDSDSSGPIQKMKKFKTNFFTKRFTKRKRDKKEKQDDQISIKSNASDTSRISLVEIKNELKKRLKKPKIRKAFTNPDDEGVGMASILARSVIHAHTSLACIAETQDSEHSVQESSMRRTSESEPNITVSDEETAKKISDEKIADIKNELEGKVPEIHFSSLKNMSSEEAVPPRERKISESCPTTPVVARSENLLKLPGDKGYFDSVSSALSGESSDVYSSSDEDDESFDAKSDVELEDTIETTTSVVKSVLNHEVNPAFIAQMERKLSTLGHEHQSTSEIVGKDDLQKEGQQAKEENIQQVETVTTLKVPAEKDDINPSKTEATDEHIKIEKPEEEIVKSDATVSAKEPDKCVPKPNTHQIKLHNPFAHKKTSKSFSAPSSPVEKSGFVYRSSKRIKNQLAKLSKSSMIKSISHYSLLPKKKEEPKTLSHPGSSSDVPSKAPSETVLGSLFMSYSDLLSLDKEGLQANRGVCKSDEFDRMKVSMYIGSEPVSRMSLSGQSFPSHHREDHDHHFHRKEKPALKPTGLIHKAMETILIDKVDTLLIPTSPDPISKNTKQFFDDVSEKLEEHKNRESSDLRTTKMSQVQATTGSTTPRVVAMTPKRLSDDFTPPQALEFGVQHKKYSILESKGLVHTAMDTILMDKAQMLCPETPEPCHTKSPFHDDDHSKHKDHKDLLSTIKSTVKDKVHVSLDSVFGKHKNNGSDVKSGGLVHTAMQTILMDRAKSIIPDTPSPITAKMEPVFDNNGRRSQKVSETHESIGLIHSALETILIDKVQTVLPTTSEPVPIHLDTTDFDRKSERLSETPTKESSGLIHGALQTILMDKVQAVLPDSPEPVPIHFDNDIKSENLHEKESSGLIHGALQTMLMDKVQAVLPNSPEPIPIHLDKDIKSEKLCEKESSGVVHGALETILMDKVQAVLPDSPEPIPIHLNAEAAYEKLSETPAKESRGLIHGALETILIDKIQAVLPDTSEPVPIHLNTDTKSSVLIRNPKDNNKDNGLVKTAVETIIIDKIQTVFPNSTDPDLVTDLPIEDSKESPVEPRCEPSIPTINKLETNLDDLKSPSLVGSAMQTILMDKVQPVIATSSADTNEINAETSIVSKDTTPEDSQINENVEETSKSKKLIRQDSIHSITEANESHKMSNESLSNMSPSKITRPPVLQHLHPILSGLETIPSMSESSFERSIEGESAFETNSASVCDNSHAACDFDRSERDRDRSEKDKGSPRHARHESYGGRDPVGSAQAQSSLNSTSTPMGIHRRSSDSDLSVTPKGGSLNTSAGNIGTGGGAILRPSMNTDNLDMLEYPFLTMTEYPPGFVVHIGGTVCARSVKLVDGGGESAARAAWWAELRTELRAHARALRCNAVIAYTDTCSICEDVCVLSASGTAVVINLDCDFNAEFEGPITVNGNKAAVEEGEPEACSVAHVPYSPGAGPYRAELSTCGGCRRARVPAVLLATCAKPNKLMSYTKAVTLTAVAARVRRAQPSSEPGARDISDQLPFLEYELHKLLLAKLRMQGANALFSLQTQIAIGERCVMALASGTAVKLTALPPPTPPRIKATENDKDALDIQRKLWDAFTANKAANGYDIAGMEHVTNGTLPEVEREDPPTLDLCADKDACVLELDEAEDVETARMLTSRCVHIQAFTNSLRPAIGVPPHAFAQVSRARLSLGSGGGGAVMSATRHVSRALDAAAYKLRRLQPSALHARLQLELPEDEIQLVLSGTAIPLMDPSKIDTSTENGHVNSQGNNSVHSHNGTGDADDDIFALDEEQLIRSQPQEVIEEKNSLSGHVAAAVSLSTLSQVPGAQLARRVCALRLLFVRETTAVRELGGLSGFLHTFTCEVLAIVRAYTAALGGNALTSFYIRQLMLQDNAHKNQGQCLLSVGGDIIHVTY